jgi:hypothetical protein
LWVFANYGSPDVGTWIIAPCAGVRIDAAVRDAAPVRFLNDLAQWVERKMFGGLAFLIHGHTSVDVDDSES